MSVSNEVRVVFSGKMPNGEIWSCGFSFDTTLGPTVDQAYMNDLAAKAVTEFTTGGLGGMMRGHNPSTWTCDVVSCYYYSVTGGPATLQSQAVIGSAGTASGNTLPNQVAIVASLRTGLPGRTKRGRVYLPLLIVSTSAGLIANAECDTIAAAVAGFLTQMSTAPSPLPEAVVASESTSSMPAITNVIVDNRFDVQRRRANRERATYSKSVAV